MNSEMPSIQEREEEEEDDNDDEESREIIELDQNPNGVFKSFV